MTELTREQIDAADPGWSEVPPLPNGDRLASVRNDPPLAERLMTAAAVCDLPDPPQSDELLGSLLVRRQRTVLGGYTGEGKTTAALAMVKAVARRETFLDWQGSGGRALVIDAEQGLRTAKRRLTEARLDDCDEIDYLRIPEGLALGEGRPEDAEIEAIIAAGNYAVVLADPLYKLHRGDSNDERHAVALMGCLDGWRDRYGFSLLLAMHPRKRPAGGTKFTLDELFGSGAFGWGPEIVLGIERPYPGKARLHFFKDRDGDLPLGEKWGLLFDREQGFTRDPEDGKKQPTAADKVRDLLEAEAGMTTEALIEQTENAERTVSDALRKIGATSQGGGAAGSKRWYLPEDDPQGELG